MRKLIERLLLFFVGLPLIIASVFFLPQHNYIVLHIELMIFTAMAILEMRALLAHKRRVGGQTLCDRELLADRIKDR